MKVLLISLTHESVLLFMFQMCPTFNPAIYRFEEITHLNSNFTFKLSQPKNGDAYVMTQCFTFPSQSK